jgi:hypothetical protein
LPFHRTLSGDVAVKKAFAVHAAKHGELFNYVMLIMERGKSPSFPVFMPKDDYE